MLDRADRAYLAGLITGALALGALGLPTLWLDLAGRNDFAEYWIGARALVQGGDPYDPVTWPALLATVNRAPSTTAYSYPPYVAVAFVPFAFLPVGSASALWTLLSVSLVALAVRALARAVAVPAPAQLLLGFALLTSQASLSTLAQGQLSFVLGAALAAAVAAQRTGRQMAAGLAAWILAAKPQVFLFAGWSLCASAARKGQRVLLATLGVGAAIAVASVFAFSGVWREWWTVLATLLNGGPQRLATLLTLATALFGDASSAVAAVTVLVLTLTTLVLARRADHPAWLALTLAAAPYAQNHDQVELIVPLTVAVGELARESSRRALALCLAGVAVLVPLAALLYAIGLARGADPFGVLVPVSIFLLTLFAPRAR